MYFSISSFQFQSCRAFIKFDFSDLPALIGAFAYGPLAGVIVEFIKNLLHCTVTQSFTVGELSNFILGAVFTGTAGLIYKKNKTKRGAIIGAIVGSVVMGNRQLPVEPVYCISSIHKSLHQ